MFQRPATVQGREISHYELVAQGAFPRRELFGDSAAYGLGGGGAAVEADDEVHVYCPIGGKPCISW